MRGRRTDEVTSSPSAISLEFDDIVYGLQRFGGISEYWRELTSRIEQMPDFEVTRSTGRPWNRMQCKHSVSRLFHSSYYRTGRGRRVRNIATVHDLAYEFGHIGSGVNAALHRLEHRRAYFASDALICVSANTRDDLLKCYPTLAQRCQLYVIPHGVSISMPAGGAGGRPAGLPEGRPYVLFVGGRGAYKDFGLALRAFAASSLPREGSLLVCTGNHFNNAEQEAIDRLGLGPSVRAAGALGRRALASLYTDAHCLLFTSYFEGFGMPLLEAMQLGCPVVASKASVMPEVCGDAALLVESRDPQAFATAMQQLLDAASRNVLIERGRRRAARYTWEASAQGHALAYREIALGP